MSHAKIFLTIVVLGTSAYANAGDLFTCKLPGNKVASVSINGAQIYYSYGKIGAQPDVQLDRTQAWFMGNQHYAGANYQLTFRVQKGNYNYVLYSQNYEDKLDEGLVVYNGSKILFNKKCTESAKVDDSVWSTQPADLGMQDESDQVSDYISSIASGAVTNNNSRQSAQDQQQTNNGQSPIEVQLNQNSAWGTMTNLIITGTANNVTINDVVVNRGNCTMGLYNYGPHKETRQRTLKYGEQTRYSFNTDCNIREIVVKTNIGNWTFNTQ
ncbi:hypothetical protein JGY68_000095 [Salmonella enterica]|nr:hypothetical protein [Salmonella enterica subsp. salamae]ECL1288134.1 hypothetical protein [Salmonella enterica]ECJ2729144.1 hypothetical protein [Salmonella enterica subsp. salamae]EEA0957364.1 hypothetical protein [Salmonella enterica]EGH5308848.1 hypothetical protein [Salmonella enterica]